MEEEVLKMVRWQKLCAVLNSELLRNIKLYGIVALESSIFMS
jgi:hypothetical protein